MQRKRSITTAVAAVLCAVALFTAPNTAYATDGSPETEAAYESEQDFLDTLNEVLSGNAATSESNAEATEADNSSTGEDASSIDVDDISGAATSSSSTSAESSSAAAENSESSDDNTASRSSSIAAEETSEDDDDEDAPLKDDVLDVDDALLASEFNTTPTVKTADTISIRVGKDTAAKSLTSVSEDTVLTVLDYCGDTGWIQVQYVAGDVVYRGFVQDTDIKKIPIVQVKTQSQRTTIYSEADEYSDALVQLEEGSTVSIYQFQNDWCQVTSGDFSGYIKSDKLVLPVDNDDISYVSSSSVLRMRDEADKSSNLVMLIPADTLLCVTGEDGDWYITVYNGQQGYILKSSVEALEEVTGGYVQSLSGSVTIRSGPDDSYAALCTMDEDTMMQVTGSMGNWLLVENGFVSGYVDASKVSTTSDSGYSTEEANKQTEARIAARVPERVKITASILTIRKSASTSSLALGYIPSGAVVAVESADGDWYKVTYGTTTGYISSDYAKETEDAVTTYVAVSSSSSSSSYSSASTSSSSSSGSGSSTSSSKSGAAVLAYAQQFVGNPYVWGGTSLTNGCDCSGFVKSVYAHFGVSLPHSSYSMRSVGKAVSVSNMQVGDIVCYSGHVGIYAGNGKLLSALGRKYGITYNSVNYKTILAVRRIF